MLLTEYSLFLGVTLFMSTLLLGVMLLTEYSLFHAVMLLTKHSLFHGVMLLLTDTLSYESKSSLDTESVGLVIFLSPRLHA